MWGFQSHGVVPDIVTMAKGIANGFPMGAIVTTPGGCAPPPHPASCDPLTLSTLFSRNRGLFQQGGPLQHLRGEPGGRSRRLGRAGREGDALPPTGSARARSSLLQPVIKVGVSPRRR